MYIYEKFYCDCCLKEIDPEKPCPYCGFDIDDYEEPSHALPHGTLLKQKYVIGSVIGEGGFGITYAGWDLALNKPIAIKEFYPQNNVTRNTEETFLVTPNGTEDNQLVYYKGVEWFQREARILAALGDTHNVVHVEDFFQANGTAYIIMDFIRGRTLADYVSEKGGKLPEAEVLNLLKNPIEALGKVHQFGLLHGDISPSNLMLADNGEVYLIDFGAATSLEADSAQKESKLFLNRNFSPMEQLVRLELGPWSDIYAMCSTMLYLMTGTPIPLASEREQNDSVPKILRTLKLSYRQRKALQHGLTVSTKRRTENTALLLYELYKVPLPKSEEEKKQQKKRMVKLTAAFLSLYIGTALFSGLEVYDKLEIMYQAYIKGNTAAAMEYAKECAWGLHHSDANYWYQWTAEHGTDAQVWEIAKLYYDNDLSYLPVNKPLALNYMSRCCDQDNTEAMILLALEYINGENISKDISKAEALLMKASTLGDPEAMVYLGLIEKDEHGKINNAFSMFKKAAELGSARGMYLTACAYLDGSGVEKSTDEGTKWMFRASAAGDPEAMGEIGGYYLCTDFIINGETKVRDVGTAMRILDDAIWWGSASAHYYKSGYYSGKYDITGSSNTESKNIPNDEKAFELMLKSAQKGYIMAMAEVADMYEQGIGTKVDLEQAAFWRKQAAEQ